MNILRIIAVLCTPLFVIGATSSPREAQLAEVKKAFPSHVAGPVTEKSDPLIRECYFEIKSIVDEMKLESAAEDVGRLRKHLESNISHYRYLYDRAKSQDLEVQTPSMRHAIEQNLSWLLQKVRPYVARLESFQRGRSI
jgi:hypothetical protein